MKKLRLLQTAGVLSIAALALAGCASNSGSESSASESAGADYSSLSGTITAGGSSAQANAQAAWTAAFTAQAKGVTINYDKSQGSGGGVTNWLSGSYDFAGSDSALKTDQATQAKDKYGADAVNLPIYLDGVAIIFNVAGVDNLKLSSETLAKIFAGQITTWNDPAIAADNEGTSLPSTKITPVTRSDGSGTTQNFTNYLKAVQPSIWTWDASNKWPVAGSSAQQGGSGVVNTVKSGDGTIGYADHSAIGDVKAASIQVGTGSDFAEFSAEGATKAFSEAAVKQDTGVEGDLTYKLDYAKISSADAYPIPLLSYAIVSTKFEKSEQAELTKAYLGFIASSQGQQVAAKNAGSAPIPDDTLAEITKSLELIK